MKTEEQKRIKILHIDDDELTLQISKKILEDENKNFIIKNYSNPDKLISELENNDYQCVIMDYLMPSITGTELAKQIRSFSDIPIIMYTGHGSEEVAVEALHAGVNDYVLKNFYMEHYELLANRINIVVQNYRYNKQLYDHKKILDAVVNTMPVYIHIYDSNLNLIHYRMNEDAKHVFSEDNIGMNILELNPKLAGSERFDKYLQVLKTGEPIQIEDYMTIGDESFYVNVSVLKINDGLGFMIFDKTQLKCLEDEKEKLLQEIKND